MHLARMGHARGVAQGDALHASRHEALHPGEHLVHRHIALHRAAKAARQRHIDSHPRLLSGGDHGLQPSPGLLAQHAQVAQVVGFAGRHDQVQFVGAGGNRALRALDVRHQAGQYGARTARGAGQHLLCIGQRRNRLGRDKGGHLHLGHAGGHQRIDQGDLVFCGHEHRLHLQAIARSDLLDEQASPGPLPHAGGAHWITPWLRNCAICAVFRPMPVSTASVSSPRCGALLRTVPGVADSLGTTPGTSTV